VFQYNYIIVVPPVNLPYCHHTAGKRMEMILHSAEKMPDSPKRCGRTIKPETEHIAARHQGISSTTFLYYFMLYYFILYYFILCYFILYYFILCYFILYYFILYYFILYYIILHYIILCYIYFLYYILLYYLFLYSILLYYIRLNVMSQKCRYLIMLYSCCYVS